MNNLEQLRALYKKYNLTEDDYFKHKHYTIITRQGIDKIQAVEDIKITYSLSYYPECRTFVVKARATHGEQEIETFGESAPNNTTNNYPVAMAEKRAMSRAVLKLAGFYELGVFGEDEADDFKKSKAMAGKKTVLDNRHAMYDDYVERIKAGALSVKDLLVEYDIDELTLYTLNEIENG